MGYVKHKYTREYFLRQDKDGCKTDIGAEGILEFSRGMVRPIDKSILSRINFKNKVVLDLGFGRGEAIKYTHEHGARKIIGVDFSRYSFQIASQLHEHYHVKADLFHDDALKFLKKYRQRFHGLKIDIVLMLDFVEHVPRKEFGQILSLLKMILSEKSILAINTPVYKIDNDVIAEGLKEEAHDTSDNYEITSGMHCNRYTKKSLVEFLKHAGYGNISNKFFAPGFKAGIISSPGHIWNKAKNIGLPLCNGSKKEIFEISRSEVNVRYINWAKLLSPRYIASIMTPPAAYIAKNILFKKRGGTSYSYKPIWHKIKGGILKDRWFYIDIHDNDWQTEIIEGTYDKFFFDYIKKLDVVGKTVFDVGAFVGSHTLAFAQAVGPQGMVYSFEPNQFNIERIKTVLSRNKDLSRRIKIVKLALWDKNGKQTFNFSCEIDKGFSSGSFISGANTPKSATEYQNISFQKCYVKSAKLDDIKKELSFKENPYIIKMDVEGAEGRILKSGQKFIAKYQPIILIEIHSPENMVLSLEILYKLHYKIQILNKEEDGRVFLAATPKGFTDNIGRANQKL